MRFGPVGLGLLTLSAAAWLAISAQSAQAFDPASLPKSAVVTHDARQDFDSFVLPLGRFADGAIPGRAVEGVLHRRAWRINSAGLSTLQITAPLREQIEEAGYDILLSCEAASCGGFDFRYGIPVLPAPAMHVDLFDYRVVTAQKDLSGGGVSYLYVLISRTRNAGFVQMFEVIEGDREQARSVNENASTPVETPVAQNVTDFEAALRRDGYAILRDVDFATGAVELLDRDYPELAAVAALLQREAGLKILLVGHTDAEGSLEANQSLSKRRAQAVVARLAGAYGVDAARMVAQGAGYLAPVASNLTAQGREAIRRVEVVLLSIE
jgi:OOP family OmpA-OmpF porin